MMEACRMILLAVLAVTAVSALEKQGADLEAVLEAERVLEAEVAGLLAPAEDSFEENPIEIDASWVRLGVPNADEDGFTCEHSTMNWYSDDSICRAICQSSWNNLANFVTERMDNGFALIQLDRTLTSLEDMAPNRLEFKDDKYVKAEVTMAERLEILEKKIQRAGSKTFTKDGVLHAHLDLSDHVKVSGDQIYLVGCKAHYKETKIKVHKCYKENKEDECSGDEKLDAWRTRKMEEVKYRTGKESVAAAGCSVSAVVDSTGFTDMRVPSEEVAENMGCRNWSQYRCSGQGKCCFLEKT